MTEKNRENTGHHDIKPLRWVNMRHADYRFIMLFLLIITVPLLQTVFRFVPEWEIKENRVLAELPPFENMNSIGSWENYLKSFETFFNDHFGFRSFLIYINSVINNQYLKVSPRSEVMIGKDGWLYYDSLADGANIQDYAGRMLFSENELSIIRNNLQDMKEYLQKKNITFVIVSAPNKHSIYEEYLPDSMKDKKGNMNRLEQVKKIAKDLQISFIDTSESIIRYKKDFPIPLYYKTDTHWNQLGAYLAYDQIIQKLSNMGFVIPTHQPPDKIAYTVSSNKGEGDLSGLINNSGNMDDLSVHISIPIEYKYQDSPYGERTIVTYLTNKPYPRLVMFRDSFAAQFLPFISSSFSRVVYSESKKCDYRIIEQEKPELVILQFAERYSLVLLDF